MTKEDRQLIAAHIRELLANAVINTELMKNKAKKSGYAIIPDSFQLGWLRRTLEQWAADLEAGKFPPGR